MLDPATPGYDLTIAYLAKKVAQELGNSQSEWVKALDDPRWVDVKIEVEKRQNVVTVAGAGTNGVKFPANVPVLR